MQITGIMGLQTKEIIFFRGLSFLPNTILHPALFIVHMLMRKQTNVFKVFPNNTNKN